MAACLLARPLLHTAGSSPSRVDSLARALRVLQERVADGTLKKLTIAQLKVGRVLLLPVACCHAPSSSLLSRVKTNPCLLQAYLESQKVKPKGSWKKDDLVAAVTEHVNS